MSDSQSRRKRDESLAFFGTMIAGQSHELTNVLNIISELAGLQHDLLTAGDDDRPIDLSRLQEVASRIKNQVDRGETIIRNTNQFAHSVDLPVAVFDLKEAIDRVLFFAERSARLAQVELVSKVPEGSMALENNPLCLQQAVFICIDLALRYATDERTVTVDYNLRQDGAEIRIVSADTLAYDDLVTEKLGFLELLLSDLGGVLVKGPGEEPHNAFVLYVPLHPGGSSGSIESAWE